MGKGVHLILFLILTIVKATVFTQIKRLNITNDVKLSLRM